MAIPLDIPLRVGRPNIARGLRQPIVSARRVLGCLVCVERRLGSDCIFGRAGLLLPASVVTNAGYLEYIR